MAIYIGMKGSCSIRIVTDYAFYVFSFQGRPTKPTKVILTLMLNNTATVPPYAEESRNQILINAIQFVAGITDYNRAHLTATFDGIQILVQTKLIPNLGLQT